jgi:hypothetical protein
MPYVDLEALSTAPLAMPGVTRALKVPGLDSRTGDMAYLDIEWVHPPHSPTRYTADSKVVSVAGYDLEIIRSPLASLEPILAGAYLDLNGIIYKGNKARPGTFMHVHLANASTLAVARERTRVIGFSLATHLVLDGHRILLHNATAVDPSVRGKALAFLLNGVHYFEAFRQSPFRGFYSVARTYNPLIYGTMLSIGPCYPRPDAQPPPDIRSVGESVARKLNPDAPYDAGVMIQRRAWKNLSSGEVPRHRRTDVNEYCDRHLNYQEGDGLIVVARFAWPEMARMTWRFLWKQLAPAKRRT